MIPSLSHKTWVPALFGLAISHASIGHATTSLDELVVVGSRAPAQISEVPGTVWVVDEEEITTQASTGKTLKQILGELVPSLDAGPQGRTNYGQNMRGRKALVMIDGVSLNSSRAVSRQFDSIDPFNIARIEVLSGATALYGGGATGGIINIVTKKGKAGETRFSSKVGASSGFNDGDDFAYEAAQSISGGNDRVQARLGVAFGQNGATYDADGDPVKPDVTQTDLQYNRSIDVLGNVGVWLNDNHRLDVTAQYYDSRYNGDTGLYLGEDFDAVTGVNPGAFGIRDGVDFDQEPATERYQISLNYQAYDVLGHTFYAQAYTRDEALNFHPFPYVRPDGSGGLQQGSYYSASRQETALSGIKLLMTRDLSDMTMSYGVDYSRERFEGDQTLFDLAKAASSGGLIADRTDVVGRYPDTDIDTLAPFLQFDYQLTPDLSLSGGLRYENVKTEIGDFVDSDFQVMVAQGLISSAEAIPGGEESYDEFLANLGAVYELSPDQQIWTNYSQGSTLPDPAKWYGQGTYTISDGQAALDNAVTVNGSPLQQVKTDQVELGWRAARAGWDAQVALYYAWSDKEVAYDRQELTVVVNDNETRNYGLEASAAFHPTTSWTVGGTTHLTRGEVKVNGDWQKASLTDASMSKVTGYVDWHDAYNQLRFQGKHLMDVEDESGNELEGRTTFDLIGNRQLPVGQVSLGIINLFNEDYSTVWGQRSVIFYTPFYGPEEMFDYKGQGRTYTLTYSVDY
ncbi:iron complex outermembrane recepter protein [Marinobacter daqiaonensis]|uniref:Ferric aerobactin receptor n=1 Tax=Marinobacter daqiaonensis TaxID=650891 RepID=A0A1I6I055_9GAMM|nr:TonB-dependent receptor [Marinobacter daqiaonensis]SFR60081.1 iron complex outermembrane recepter protein [Marinobacter daqiaonensis]